MGPMRVLLISTYELGRQPFGLASPAAFLEGAGAAVRCLDLSVQRLDEEAVRDAAVIAFYLPMHTATRIALAALDKVRAWNPDAHLCAYGLYAPVNTELLRRQGVETILGGEFEDGLVKLVERLGEDGEDAATGAAATEPDISLARQDFLRPSRGGLPPLSEYAHLIAGGDERRTVGYTEASRGCKHLCRHCPVVPVYGGQFRVVQPEVVLADIRQQVAMGAEHITFGDPDFLNGPTHALAIVRELHREHPGLSYDVTIKVEHLLRHADALPVLRETGCAFVTSAVEALDDEVLALLDKGHTRAEFIEAVELCAEAGVAIQPTFVTFTPWITLAGYEDLLATLAKLELIDNVPSIQLAIRLLIPEGSRLLELAEVRDLVDGFDETTLGYRWAHPDPRVDALQRGIEELVAAAPEGASRQDLFFAAWRQARVALGADPEALPAVAPGRPRVTIPYLSEPWYC